MDPNTEFAAPEGGSATPDEQPATPAAPEAPVAAPEQAASDPDAALEAELDEILAKADDDGEETTDDTTDDAAQKRGPDGKFVAKNPEAKADGENQDTDADNPDAQEGSTEKPAPPAVDAPAHWSREAKERFAELPAEVQSDFAAQALQDRQTISRLGEQAQSTQPLMEAVGEFQAAFDAKGISHADGVRQILQVQDMLDRDAKAGLLHIAQAYNVDLNELLVDHELGLTQDPKVTALEQHNQALQRQMEQLARQQAAAQEQAQVNELTQVINTFAADKPDFDLIANDISAEFSVLEQTNPGMPPHEMIKQAYETAQWRNPQTRAKLMEQQTAVANKDRIALAERARESAKQAGKINVNSSPASHTPLSLDDELDAVLARHA